MSLISARRKIGFRASDPRGGRRRGWTQQKTSGRSRERRHVFPRKLPRPPASSRIMRRVAHTTSARPLWGAGGSEETLSRVPEDRKMRVFIDASNRTANFRVVSVFLFWYFIFSSLAPHGTKINGPFAVCTHVYGSFDCIQQIYTESVLLLYVRAGRACFPNSSRPHSVNTKYPPPSFSRLPRFCPRATFPSHNTLNGLCRYRVITCCPATCRRTTERRVGPPRGSNYTIDDLEIIYMVYGVLSDTLSKQFF